MKNRHEVRGCEAVIFLPFRGDELQTVIDLTDLPRVQELPGTWYANPAKTPAGKFYALGKLWDRRAGRSRTVMLHRWILDTPRGLEAHHVDNDGLNNRRSNLQQLTHQGNIRERWTEKDYESARLAYRRRRMRLARELRAETGLSRQAIWSWFAGKTRVPPQHILSMQSLNDPEPTPVTRQDSEPEGDVRLPPGMTAKQYARAKVWGLL